MPLGYRSGAGRADDDAGQLTLVKTCASARRRTRRQIGEAGAVEDGIAEGCSRLYEQSCGMELVRRLRAGALGHRARQALILEGSDLDRPSPTERCGWRAD